MDSWGSFGRTLKVEVFSVGLWTSDLVGRILRVGRCGLDLRVSKWDLVQWWVGPYRSDLVGRACVDRIPLISSVGRTHKTLWAARWAGASPLHLLPPAFYNTVLAYLLVRRDFKGERVWCADGLIKDTAGNLFNLIPVCIQVHSLFIAGLNLIAMPPKIDAWIQF